MVRDSSLVKWWCTAPTYGVVVIELMYSKVASSRDTHSVCATLLFPELLDSLAVFGVKSSTKVLPGSFKMLGIELEC